MASNIFNLIYHRVDGIYFLFKENDSFAQKINIKKRYSLNDSITLSFTLTKTTAHIINLLITYVIKFLVNNSFQKKTINII